MSSKWMWPVVCVAPLFGAIGAETGPEAHCEAMFKEATYPLSEAIEKALKLVKGGDAVQAEIERPSDHQGRVIYSIDVAQGTKTCVVELDAKDGSMLVNAVEEEDFSARLEGAGIPLSQAIQSALKKVPGRAVHALMEGSQAQVLVLSEGKLHRVSVEAGGAQAREVRERPFTDLFFEEAGELGPTGENPYFILKPGYFLRLSGEEDGHKEEIRIDVTERTVTIDGIEARVVEERCWKDGELVEVALDYFAISKRTNNVYYLGEDVDNYKDGKVADHDGTWHSGKNGCRFGLMMLGEPVLGARYHQEIAPPTALDRAEIVSVNASMHVISGREFKRVLVTEETTPLKASEKECKMYARGVGLVQDGAMRLVESGWSKDEPKK